MSDPEVEHTPDGHHIVVNGRKWRATDSRIPEKFRTELVAELMRARRLVGTRGDAARPMVDDAKVALGERGEPWWEVPTETGLRERLAATIRALLRHRDGTTICPSDAARVVGGEGWRDVVPVAREVASELAAHDVVVVQQKGQRVDVRTARGPVRIAPGPSLERAPQS
ncbi:DUF3253 domain-containing protein [Nocardioides piscis]|uniref:DUF3253 domain-containing protein n=1 Tax=Nocardioides piscis TaxID=2714938 RepID=A0A6G7YHH1_9ACTN|nr:DUF3253 domain-containing protein [Nocardioides piscis]QIK76265.1 DUF3253 domain-containing protein [Nocardioides piscis]